MERKSIIDKVKKLREHSVERGATEAEAIAFALKAQKLIADNGIEEWELEGGEPDEVARVYAETKIRRAWLRLLFSVVAKNFRCRPVLTTTADGKRDIPTFLGHRSDAEAAAIVFTHLLEVGHKLGKRHEDDFYTDPDAYENFVRGFVCGVAMELEKQAEALMLTVPQDVEDHVRKMPLRNAPAPRRIRENAASMARGCEAGQDAVRARRIAG